MSEEMYYGTYIMISSFASLVKLSKSLDFVYKSSELYDVGWATIVCYFFVSFLRHFAIEVVNELNSN